MTQLECTCPAHSPRLISDAVVGGCSPVKNGELGTANCAGTHVVHPNKIWGEEKQWAEWMEERGL